VTVKFTLQGLLIYITMGAFLISFALTLARMKKASLASCLAGFAAAIVSYGYRWSHAGHVPLKDLFEVMLFMGLVMAPLSLLCRRFLRAGHENWDMLIAAVVLFPAGFVFEAEPRMLPPALQSPLFAPHVAVYMLAYVILAKAAVQAIAQLVRGDEPAEPDLARPEVATYRLVCLGFPLLTLGLVLGSWWGKIAWGDYWNWDPKELWSFASWLVYVGYLHFRYRYGRRYAWVNATIAICGFAVIVITLLWVNLAKVFKGLHSYAS